MERWQTCYVRKRSEADNVRVGRGNKRHDYIETAYRVCHRKYGLTKYHVDNPRSISVFPTNSHIYIRLRDE